VKRGFFATALVLLTGVVYGLLVEPNWLKVSHLILPVFWPVYCVTFTDT